jgi:hypothetical protein
MESKKSSIPFSIFGCHPSGGAILLFLFRILHFYPSPCPLSPPNPPIQGSTKMFGHDHMVVVTSLWYKKASNAKKESYCSTEP